MPPRLAVQLYSFGSVAPDGWSSIFEAIARTGLTSIETVNVPTGDPATARRLAADHGLTIESAHTSVNVRSMEGLEGRIAAIAEMGARWAFTPALVPIDLVDVATIERTAEVLDEARESCRRHGLGFGIHNHEHEFALLDGTPAWRLLLERVDPTTAWQLDVYWATAAGVAPTEAIAALGDRLVSVHLKDGTGRRDDPNVALGDGQVDIAGSLAAARAKQTVETAIVEFDSCAGDVVEAIARSTAYLRGLGG
jgi:sugar phosphate isomerase/epimerase